MTKPELEAKALDLQRRIRDGENIPLDEMRQFILLANSEVVKDRKKEEKGENDVSFF